MAMGSISDMLAKHKAAVKLAEQQSLEAAKEEELFITQLKILER